MKALKYFLISILLLSIGNQSQAQGEGKSPKIGDRCPDYFFKTIINGSPKSAKISSFRGKYLILDFWGTWCGSCVEAIPREDSIQKAFKKSLQFMMISAEKPTVIQRFFSKANKTSKLSLVSASDESWDLAQLFKVRYVPHYVWINKVGKIEAITSQEEITWVNITKFINGDYLDLPLKSDVPRKNVEFSEPFLSDSILAKGTKVIRYNVVSGFMPGYPVMTGMPNYPNYFHRRLIAYNNSIAGLYRLAYSENFFPHDFPFVRTIVNVKDTTRILVGTTLKTWNKNSPQYAVCYDLIIPVPDTVLLFKTMREDLDRLYGLKVKIEQRSMPCLVLKITKPGLLNTIGEKPFEENNQLSITLRNKSIKTLCDDIYEGTESKNVTAIVDETSFSANIDLQINANLKDLVALNIQLAKYGLNLVPELRKIDVLVLSD